MNLVRHELGLSEKDTALPTEGDVPRHLLARGQCRRSRWMPCCASSFPGARSGRTELRELFEAYVEAKQRQHVLDYDDLLLYWAELMRVPELAGEVGALFDHVLVDEYQDTNALQAGDPARPQARRRRPDRRRRRCAGDLRLPRRHACATSSISQNCSRRRRAIVTLEQNYRSTQPILAASNAVIGLARERFTKNLRSRAAPARKAGAGHGRRRHRPGRLRRRNHPGEPRGAAWR